MKKLIIPLIIFLLTIMFALANVFSDNCSINPSYYYVYDDFENVANTTYWTLNASYQSFNSTYAYSGTYSLQCSAGNSKICMLSKIQSQANSCILFYASWVSISSAANPALGVGTPTANYVIVADNTAGGTANKYNYYNGAWGTYNLGYSLHPDWDRIEICYNGSKDFDVNITNATGTVIFKPITNAQGGSAYTDIYYSLGTNTLETVNYDKFMMWDKNTYGTACPPASLDTPPPLKNDVNFTSPTPDNNSKLNATSFIINISSNFGSDYCEAFYDELPSWDNMTSINETSFFYDVLVIEAPAIHWYRARCLNESDELVYSENRTINITYQYPCVEDWQLLDSVCINNSKLISYLDANSCNTTEFLPSNNGTAIYCKSEVSGNYENNILYIILAATFLILLYIGAKNQGNLLSGAYAIAGIILIIFVAVIYYNIVEWLTDYIKIYWIPLLISLMLAGIFLIFYGGYSIIKNIWRG